MAIAMIATVPPRGHVADARAELDARGRYRISVGSAEFGNGTTTVHAQLAAARSFRAVCWSRTVCEPAQICWV
ncbi:Xanthine dehydrogenase family protein [Mycobacteroides abscessus subsp. abscessus]|nr:Xanthine dehydrogenase family protein [Mycobacteroides abscessus subsp. abscessus]